MLTINIIVLLVSRLSSIGHITGNQQTILIKTNICSNKDLPE